MTPFLLRLALGGLNLINLAGAALRRFFAALDLQGWVGLAASILLGLVWLHAASEARHWQKQSGQFEKLWSAEKMAHAKTVANYRAAADQARQADAANAARVEAEQGHINERTSHDYEVRIADARARFERLRIDAQAAADSGRGAGAPVPGLPATPGRAAEAAGQDRLPSADALTATEQAIQLDELIKWVRAQARVDNNGGAATNP
jgi:hypothetical protein